MSSQDDAASREHKPTLWERVRKGATYIAPERRREIDAVKTKQAEIARRLELVQARADIMADGNE